MLSLISWSCILFKCKSANFTSVPTECKRVYRNLPMFACHKHNVMRVCDWWILLRKCKWFDLKSHVIKNVLLWNINWNVICLVDLMLINGSLLPVKWLILSGKPWSLQSPYGIDRFNCLFTWIVIVIKCH